jgi:hypothetical protein
MCSISLVCAISHKWQLKPPIVVKYSKAFLLTVIDEEDEEKRNPILQYWNNQFTECLLLRFKHVSNRN